ncbi:WXG100 family type VII secretion target [Streptomyces sp. ODS28]|uniref:WXG100 family type VII secretion target n=1 Tax=Streptomyces sp. ODS28 TaxID=3136688 RepID=UPI0031EC09E6
MSDANSLGEIAVKYGSLEHAATTIDNSAKRLRGDIEVLQNEVKAVAESWEGEAHNAYTQIQANWDRDADGLFQALTKIANLVRQASDDYRETDKKGAAYFSL